MTFLAYQVTTKNAIFYSFQKIITPKLRKFNFFKKVNLKSDDQKLRFLKVLGKLEIVGLKSNFFWLISRGMTQL